MSELLDIVNDNDEIIGQEERDDVHRLGHTCRLIYVCFFTPEGKVILQKRGPAKKNDPGKFTTAVSGHVGSGQSYLQAAVRETIEETGVEVHENELLNFGVVRADYTQGDYLSNAMRGLFAYEFKGEIADLRIEEVDGAGFEILTIDEFETQLAIQPDKFAVVLTGIVGKTLIENIRKQK